MSAKFKNFICLLIALSVGLTAINGLAVPKFLDISLNLSCISSDGKYGSYLPRLKSLKVCVDNCLSANSFRKEVAVDWKQVPWCIETENKEQEKLLLQLVQNIKKETCILDSKQRLALHVSAVFANNFTNHLLTLTGELLDSHQIDPLMVSLVAQPVIHALFLLNIYFVNVVEHIVIDFLP